MLFKFKNQQFKIKGKANSPIFKLPVDHGKFIHGVKGERAKQREGKHFAGVNKVREEPEPERQKERDHDIERRDGKRAH